MCKVFPRTNHAHVQNAQQFRDESSSSVTFALATELPLTSLQGDRLTDVEERQR
jgi:hypothetical protein